MATQEENARKLIKSLKRRKNIDNLSVHESNNNGWINYFSICGFLKDEYFSFTITKMYKEKCEISILTDCKEEIKKILVQYNLI
jgi:hypothetical protein